MTGDALAVLKTLQSESVQCVVTSPPYWGLRSYSTNPQVWGGSAGCRHEWGPSIRTPWANDVAGPNGAVKNGAHSRQKAKQTGPFCDLCGAWRGELGLEPTIDLYVAHIVEVFREVRRVLKSDGTLWLNLGDSYATGAGKACSPGGGAQGENWQGPQGYRGGHAASPKHCLETIPAFQPNRMPQAGLKPKDLCMIPARVALALQADGWWVRSDIVWHKTNPMPESVTDRPTKSHEYLFLLTKSQRYYYDHKAIMETCQADTHARYARGRGDKHKWSDGGPGNQTIATNRPGSLFAPGVNPKARLNAPGSKQNASWSAAVKDVVERRNKRTVWTVPTAPYKGAHFATFPPKLIEPCILAGSRKGDVVLDPFAGAGTSGLVAQEHGRRFLGIELNPAYCEMAKNRLAIKVAASAA